MGCVSLPTPHPTPPPSSPPPPIYHPMSQCSRHHEGVSKGHTTLSCEAVILSSGQTTRTLPTLPMYKKYTATWHSYCHSVTLYNARINASKTSRGDSEAFVAEAAATYQSNLGRCLGPIYKKEHTEGPLRDQVAIIDLLSWCQQRSKIFTQLQICMFGFHAASQYHKFHNAHPYVGPTSIFGQAL